MYKWASYNKTISSAVYFVIETLRYRNFCRLNKKFLIMFSLVYGGLNFSLRILNFFMSTFWRPELLVPRRFVAGMFWRCNIWPPKNKNLALIYETRALFSYEFWFTNLCYRRLTCILQYTNTLRNVLSVKIIIRSRLYILR